LPACLSIFISDIHSSSAFVPIGVVWVKLSSLLWYSHVTVGSLKRLTLKDVSIFDVIFFFFFYTISVSFRLGFE
jgi:hypothetical protein